ncbi:MAG: DUF6382 domain-containing protein [Eubacteriales bacterium]
MTETVYDSGALANFEIEILTNGEHDVFLKQNISIIGDQIHIFADSTGFSRISQKDIETPLKLLDFLEKLCLNLRRAENYMFDLEKLKIEMSLIYFDENRKLAFKYEPDGESEEIAKKMEKLTYEIPVAGTACNDYLNIFREKLLKNCSLDKLVAIVGQMKREAYYCGHN